MVAIRSMVRPSTRMVRIPKIHAWSSSTVCDVPSRTKVQPIVGMVAPLLRGFRSHSLAEVNQRGSPDGSLREPDAHKSAAVASG